MKRAVSNKQPDFPERAVSDVFSAVTDPVTKAFLRRTRDAWLTAEDLPIQDPVAVILSYDDNPGADTIRFRVLPPRGGPVTLTLAIGFLRNLPDSVDATIPRSIARVLYSRRLL